MPTILYSTSGSFESDLQDFLDKTYESMDVSEVVRDIIVDVRMRGDLALLEYTNKFDRVNYNANNLRISASERDEIAKTTPPDVKEALQVAYDRITEYHKTQFPENLLYKDSCGNNLGWKWTAISDVGIYVPGGLASYPSSVLMNAIPAKVAGVGRLVMVVPTPDNEINPAIMEAACLCEIDEIYRVGGAQAVAALAYGTELIKPVYKIAGPGNAYVAEAKRQVFGKVGIDSIAGPSEILVVADDKNNPAWIAADLLSQAEHDEDASSILVINNKEFADKVMKEAEVQIAVRERGDIMKKSWNNNGLVIIVPELSDAPKIIDIIAPEHLELAIDNSEALADKISNAGAIFLGRYTPEPIGDYVAGPNHTLPTSGTAKFSSGLSVLEFMKRTTLTQCSKEGFEKIAPYAETLAKSESLTGHKYSVSVRL